MLQRRLRVLAYCAAQTCRMLLTRMQSPLWLLRHAVLLACRGARVLPLKLLAPLILPPQSGVTHGAVCGGRAAALRAALLQH